MRTQTLYDRLPERIVTYPDPVLRERCRPAVSYTHLTLPTIYSV